MSDLIYDYAVIGAGMAGASLAAELSAHAKVLLLEAEDQPGYHSTGRSAAFWEECYGGPGVVPLTLGSGPYLKENGFLRQRGALYIGRAEDRSAMDNFVTQFSGTGVTIERLDRSGLGKKVPQLRDDWQDAIWEPACADIDVAGLHQHYLGKAKRNAAELKCRARVSRAAFIDGAWEIATERREQFRAAVLINAAGAWADTIAELAGLEPIGIAPLRRTVAQLRVSPAAPEDLPLVLDVSGNFYFKSDNGRLWLSPHDEIPTVACDAAPDELDVALAIDRFEKATNWTIEAVERRWAGLRSFAPDRLPVYGRAPQNRAFYWFAGQGGFGIQTASAAAKLAAQDLLGLEPDRFTDEIDRLVFSPDRFERSASSQARANM